MNVSGDLAQSFGDVLAHSVGARQQFARLFIQLDCAVSSICRLGGIAVSQWMEDEQILDSPGLGDKRQFDPC